MCKTLPVLLLMGNSFCACLQRNNKVSLKAWPEVQLTGCIPRNKGEEPRVVSPEPAQESLNHLGDLQQVDLLPLAFHNAGANLGCCLALLVLLVAVVKLFQASRALRAVGAFKAAVEAVVAHAVAEAIARLLVKHVWNLRRQLIRVGLVSILRVGAPQVSLGQNRRQLRSLGRRRGIVGWHGAFRLR